MTETGKQREERMQRAQILHEAAVILARFDQELASEVSSIADKEAQR